MAFTQQQRTALKRYLSNKSTDQIIDFIDMSGAEKLVALRAFAASERAAMLAQRDAMAASLAEFDAMIAEMRKREGG